MSAVGYEFARVRSVRSTWWGVLVLLALSAGATWIALRQAGSLPPDAPGTAHLLTAGPGPTPLLVPAVMFGAVLSCAHDQRRDALPALLIALPRRVGTFVAKAVTTALFAALVAALALAADGLVAGAVFDLDLLRAQDWGLAPAPRILGGYVAYVALAALLGFAVGTMSRGSPVVAVVLAVLPFGGERLIAAAVRAGAFEGSGELVRFLPFGAADRVLTLSGDGLPPVAGIAVFAGVTAVALLIAAAVFNRRRA